MLSARTIKKDHFPNKCPICDSSESQVFCEVKNDGIIYFVRKCHNCLHYYSYGDLNIENSELYNDEVYKIVDNRGSIYSKIIDYESERVLKNIGRFYPKGSRLLDFGSGKGNFLFMAKKLGYEVTGIETATERAEFAEKKFNLKIIRSQYTGGKVADEAFDIITLFHVLEHLPNPKELLSNLIGHNLKENGMIIMEVPNLSSLQSQIAGNNWMHLDIPRHLSHFTKERLIRFVAELNLKVIKIEYFSLHLGVLGMCQSILSLFGYKNKILKDLKHYNFILILSVIIVLPFALIMEVISSIFNRGGIICVYCEKIPRILI